MVLAAKYLVMQPWVQTAVQPLLPAYETARGYTGLKLRRDMLAGITVAALDLPQAIAYAVIAGVPPQYGVYTSIIQGFIAALLSSSNHLAAGPTNTQGLLIVSAATRLAGANPEVYLQLVFALALLKGVIQLLFAAGGMGNMVRYVSRSVILGLMAGAGVLIGIGQLPAFLGLHIDKSNTFMPGVLGTVEAMSPHLLEFNSKTIGLGLFTVAIIVTGRIISRKIPGPILAITGSAAIVYFMGWNSKDLALVGNIPHGLPHFQIPHITWDLWQQTIGAALALAILGMLESVAIVKAISSQTGERINPNQEFLTQGVSNFVSSFFNCIPGSASFTRSALNHSAGGMTRFAGAFASIFVAIFFLALSGEAQYIPYASLAGMLLIIASDLINWKPIFRTAMTSKEDAIVCLGTFVATLTAPLEYAIFIGVFLNIGLFVRRSSRLQLSQMVAAGGPDNNKYIEQPIKDASGNQPVLFLQMEGDLFFGVADELEDRLSRIAHSPARVVVFRLKRTNAVDSSVLHVFEQFIRQMKQRSAHVLLCGVKPELMQQLHAYGLADLLGKHAIFEASHDVFSSAKRALEHARHLVGQSIDVDSVPQANESDHWSSYNI